MYCIIIIISFSVGLTEAISFDRINHVALHRQQATAVHDASTNDNTSKRGRWCDIRETPNDVSITIGHGDKITYYSFGSAIVIGVRILRCGIKLADRQTEGQTYIKL